MKNRLRHLIRALHREELAGFVPAAIAIALLIMMITYLLSDGAIFKGLQTAETKNSTLEALATAHRAPEELKDFIAVTSSGSVELNDDLPGMPNAGLENFSTYIRANINADDVEVYTAVYNGSERISDCRSSRVQGDPIDGDTLCPSNLAEATFLENSEIGKVQILSFAYNQNGELIAFDSYPVNKVPAVPYGINTVNVSAYPEATQPPVCE